MTKARKDANHGEIKKAFIDMGFSVLDVAQLKNCCDLFVAKYGLTYAVEIKDGSKVPSKRKLTPGEEKFANEWAKTDGGLWVKIESLKDVEKLHNHIIRQLGMDEDW